MQDTKEQQKKESSVDQQTEKNEDKPNDSTELDKGREKITQDELQAKKKRKGLYTFYLSSNFRKRKGVYAFYLSSNFRKRKGVYLFIYLPILERGKVCISLFIFKF